MNGPDFSPSRADRLAAEAWAEVREPLDRQLSPLGLRAIEALAPRPGEVVVDVGCGTGQTLLQLAERVGSRGSVVGVDRAPLLVAVARERTRDLPAVTVIEGDARLLDRPARSVDAVFSRFGVMAFPDPVGAFANFHRMLKPTGRLAFVCWRTLEENELDLVPLQAAGLAPLADATPFSFSAPGVVRDILERAGFRNLDLVAHDDIVTSGDLDAMVTVLARVGPLGKILRDNPDLAGPAEARLRLALAARGDPSRVGLRAATWVVTARA